MSTVLRATLRVAVGAAALTLGHAVALACSCMPPSLNDVEGDYAAVFVGEARRGNGCAGNRQHTTTFVVEEAFHGAAVGERVQVRHRTDEAACGVDFRRGERYLVFAYDGDDGLTTNLCAPGGPLELHEETLERLRSR